MKTLILTLLLSLAACSPASAEDFRAEPANSKAVEVLVFKSESCGPCRQAMPKIGLLRKQGVRVRVIDVDKHPAVADKYGVSRLPTYIVEERGVEIKRTSGILSLLAFLGWLLGLIF